VALTWGLSILATRHLLKRSARDGAAISMAACFGNIVMLGIPLSLDRFGAEAGVPLALILSISSPLLWFAGTLHIELASRKGGMALGAMLKDLAVSLLKNPIILGLLAGIA